MVHESLQQKVTVTQKEDLTIISKSFGEMFASFKNSHIHNMVGIGAARMSRPGKIQNYEQDHHHRRGRENESSQNTEYSSEIQGNMTYNI